MTAPKRTDIKNPTLWHFPMDYPISIIGHEGEHERLYQEVVLILAEHFADFDISTLQIRPSKTGRFCAIKANLYITSEDEINRLYASLAAAKTVYTVL